MTKHARCIFCGSREGYFGPGGPHFAGRCKSSPVTKGKDGSVIVSRDALVIIGEGVIAKAAKAKLHASLLEKEAKSWDQKAKDYPAATGELKTYYRGKARECRARAAQVRKELGE